MTGPYRPHNTLRSWFLAGIVIVAVVIALQDSFAAMLRLWLEIEHFNHCLLVAPVSIWLIWRQRHVLAGIEPRVSWTGLVAVILVSGVWLLGEIGDVAVVQDFAAVGLLPLSIWVIFGTPTARAILFPLGYLFFLVPFGGFLIPVLMEFTADMTVAAVRASGVAIYHDGLYFAISKGSFRIIEACSGIRMLMAGIAVGALFAYLNFHSWLRRVLFLACVFVMAIVANWVRAYIVVMMAHLSGMELVADHVWLGYVIFAILILVMLWGGWRFSDVDNAGGAGMQAVAVGPAAPAAFVTTLAAACVIVVVVSSAPMFAATLTERAAQTIRQPVAALPVGEGRWSGPGETVADWSPQFHGDMRIEAGRYTGPGAGVEIYIVSYRSLSPQSELINETNRVYDPQRWMLVGETTGTAVTAGGDRLAYYETEIYEFGGLRRLVRHWYVIDGMPYRNRVIVKLIELGNILQGRPTAAGVIAISTPVDDDPVQAGFVLDAFIADMIRMGSE